MLIALCTDQAKQKRKYISILNDIYIYIYIYIYICRRDLRDFVVGHLKPKIGQQIEQKRTEKKERTKQKMDNYD